ncbi:MAG: rRNA maturation RNase YbeY [Boseongicola sp.]|nr:rRNA maturation RNase YbeY [Boseongicola sp.]MDD9979243.1 rRNA maturation RNase YbeY [Boseongicola sp.]
MGTDVIIEDPRWSEIELEELAAQAVSATLRAEGLNADDWDVAVLGCDDNRITELNVDFREKSSATNVLSWPSEERSNSEAGKRPNPPTGDPELGDIAIAYETTVKEAVDGKIPTSHHVTHLIVHATLHLLGYDHERDIDGDLMEAREIAILETLGLPNPYQGDVARRALDDGKD